MAERITATVTYTKDMHLWTDNQEARVLKQAFEEYFRTNDDVGARIGRKDFEVTNLVVEEYAEWPFMPITDLFNQDRVWVDKNQVKWRISDMSLDYVAQVLNSILQYSPHKYIEMLDEDGCPNADGGLGTFPLVQALQRRLINASEGWGI